MKSTVPLTKIKVGEAFRFDADWRLAPVFVKCRGGFRPGRGGQLHACRPQQPVYRHTGMEGV
jgi:hypothetical protein